MECGKWDVTPPVIWYDEPKKNTKASRAPRTENSSGQFFGRKHRFASYIPTSKTSKPLWAFFNPASCIRNDNAHQDRRLSHLVCCLGRRHIRRLYSRRPVDCILSFGASGGFEKEDRNVHLYMSDPCGRSPVTDCGCSPVRSQGTSPSDPSPDRCGASSSQEEFTRKNEHLIHQVIWFERPHKNDLKNESLWRDSAHGTEKKCPTGTGTEPGSSDRSDPTGCSKVEE